MYSIQVSLFFALYLINISFAYTWPNRLVEELEHLLVDNSGYNAASFSRGVTPCSIYIQGPQNTGRQTSAQWMRVAFHDFATADVHAGTGGMDASIGWETNRPENSGQAMNDSLSFWSPFVNKYASMADMVALGTVVASASCSGPHIPYKGGRIDATQGGAFGVPEPDQPVNIHLARMAAAGFDQKSFIQLTACGHTIGSVHHAGFPTIVGVEAVTPNNTQGGIHLDNTEDVFDSSVVTTYLDGTTTNPLVKSFNETNRSDLRLFTSDGNTTMKTLTDNDIFKNVCSKVLGQMINTVPSGVELQDVTPMAVKPVNIQLTIDANAQLKLDGAIRLLGSSFPENTNRVVSLQWKSRDGSRGDSANAHSAASTTGSSFTAAASTFYYLFSLPLTTAHGVSSFTIAIDEKDGSRPKIFDNGGSGFSVQDDIFWLSALSNFTLDSTQSSAAVVVSAAVRDAARASDVHAVFSLPVPQIGTQTPKITTQTVSLVPFRRAISGYTIYSGKVMIPNVNGTAARTTFDLVASVRGKAVADDFKKLVIIAT